MPPVTGNKPLHKRVITIPPVDNKALRELAKMTQALFSRAAAAVPLPASGFDEATSAEVRAWLGTVLGPGYQEIERQFHTGMDQYDMMGIIIKEASNGKSLTRMQVMKIFKRC